MALDKVFLEFLDRVATKSEFKPINNRLRDALMEEAKKGPLRAQKRPSAGKKKKAKGGKDVVHALTGKIIVDWTHVYNRRLPGCWKGADGKWYRGGHLVDPGESAGGEGPTSYGNFFENLQDFWANVKSKAELARLLFDNYEYVFTHWLTTLLPFRAEALDLANPEMPTSVDFKLDFEYAYELAEIEALDAVIADHDLKSFSGDLLAASAVIKRLFIFSVSALGPTVAEIVEKPFSFQIFSVDAEDLDDGGVLVKTIMSGREQ